MLYVPLDPRFDIEQLGYLPEFMSEDDPRPAREQLDANYQHGGGWRPIPGWTFDAKTMILRYPGDPPFRPFAFTKLHDDIVAFYPHALVLLLHDGGTYEVARMD